MKDTVYTWDGSKRKGDPWMRIQNNSLQCEQNDNNSAKSYLYHIHGQA